MSSDAIALSLDIPFNSPTLNWEDDGLTVADDFGSAISKLSRHRAHVAARVRAYDTARGSKKNRGGCVEDALGRVGGGA